MNQYCPITGLRVFSRPEWINNQVSDTFTANFYIIGDAIIYSLPLGKADLTGVKNSLALNDEVAKYVSKGTGSYIQIEDYAVMRGATQAARNYFIKNVDVNKRRQALIFCNLSPPLSIAVKIGNRFVTTLKNIHVAKQYKGAIKWALEISDQQNFEQRFWALDGCIQFNNSERSLTPVHIIYDKQWDIQTPGFSSRSVIIDKHILYTISDGFIETKHIPLIDRNYLVFQAALPEGATIDYIVVDLSQQKGVTRSVRRKYIQVLREWYRQFPFRLYILQGDNTFMRAAALLPRPFLPFKIKFSRGCNQTFNIIREDKLGIPAKKKRKKKKTDSPETNQQNIEKLSTLISNINWEKEGVDSNIVVSEQDPFYTVFQSINLVKEELDSLIAERKKAEEALQNSNKQLQTALSDLKLTHEKMVQQERLAAVGQLAAGIAHDFNNILTSILIYTELLQMSADMPAMMQSKLKRINDSGHRAAHLVRQLLDFSRKTIRQPEQIELAGFTKETINFFERTIPENIQITLTLDPEGQYMIEADPTQLQQVITNLIVNARDAMATGGKLQIELSQVECGDNIECALCNQSMQGEWIQLKVMDTGCGIEADVLPRIFEPFFTTKDVGIGTGLGLSQVAGIVAQHSGHIRVKSQVGHGTTFSIYLTPASCAEASENEPARLKQGRGETILLVEDESIVLEATTAMLEHLNYRVISAANGHEALAAYQEHGAEIGLVMSDMIMPDITGEALFHMLKKRNPEIKMVLMSGYPLVEQRARLLEHGIINWIQKPVDYLKLAQVIGSALSIKKGRWD